MVWNWKSTVRQKPGKKWQYVETEQAIENYWVNKKVKREREKISEDKWKGKIQNVWDAAQRALTGKFIAIYVYLKLK